MIICEYFFKEFYSRGSDEYLNAWAAEVDRMGWEDSEGLGPSLAVGRKPAGISWRGLCSNRGKRAASSKRSASALETPQLPARSIE